jgi:hypothetical protein
MSYTINLTNGNLLVTIPDGTINTSACSQTLIGKNYAGYGQFLDDNFVHLLENAANATAPTAPLRGQLWYNTTSGVLQVYNGSVFKTLASANAASSAPSSNSIGDLWYDTTNAQLNVWTGSAWLLVGPIYSAATGITGAVPAVILDNTATSHVVVQLYVNDVIVGFISEDPSFTPQTTVTGFTTIRPGITLATTLLNGQAPLFQGTATNAQALGNVTANSFMRTDSNTSTSGSITINSSGTAVALINAAGSAVGNIGSSSVPFNTIFATATSAQYADVAERFAADEEYAPGTVVELGGSAEITRSNTELSESVFGVISTRAAYLMNGGAGNDLTHPPVAMTGRVPVQVTGVVQRGDRLVSAGSGIARAAAAGEATAFNVIGRSLNDKLDSGLGTVEAIVTIK